MLVAVLVMLVVSPKCRQRPSVNTEGLDIQIWWILSAVYQLPPKLAASERVGGLCRYRLAACSGIGNVGSYHRNRQRAAQVNTEGLGQYNFGGSGVYQLPPQKLAAPERVGACAVTRIAMLAAAM
jgi:hypothetical protein